MNKSGVLLVVAWLVMGLPISGQAAHLSERVETILYARHAALSIGDVDPYIAMALIYAESRGNPRAVSHKGALGAAQVMPKTAREMGVLRIGLLLDRPEINIITGLLYLKENLRRFKGRYDLALGAYNAGPTLTSRIGKVPRASQGYVKLVFTIARRLRQCEMRSNSSTCIQGILEQRE